MKTEYDINNDLLHLICGAMDANLRIIEKAYDVELVARNDKLKILGEEPNIYEAKDLLKMLEQKVKNGSALTEQDTRYAIDYHRTLIDKENESKNENANEDALSDYEKLDTVVISRTITGKLVKPKTVGQLHYIESIQKNMITFGIGPAGTGKTYLGMCMAIEAFRKKEVNRIILTRPAIEAGEKLGFLPGDLQSKIDPYLRPLYDALYQIMGVETFRENLEKGLIEVAPLAYMRGRTLDNSFIILDEAQNTTISQMKMFLTRVGFGSKVIVTGDDTQKDLPKDQVSGLDNAMRVLKNIEGISIIKLSANDVVRHPLVQKIVVAYENYEKRHFIKNEKK